MEVNDNIDLNADEIKCELSDDENGDGNNNVVFACDKCPASCDSKEKLAKHCKRIHSEKKYICPTCGFEIFGYTNS